MGSDGVIYLCISLPWSEERRRSIAEQAARLGIDILFIDAVAGKTLPPVVPQYDAKKRFKTFSWDLFPNEIACVLSHAEAMRFFLDSGAEYAVIMEDDALLADHLVEAVREITQSLRGWEMAKLNTDDNSVLYSIGDEGGVYTRAVFPKKLLWVSVGWLYTRRGALRMLESLSSFSLPADVQIGHSILEHQIPAIGITPSLITTSDPHSINSTLRRNSAPPPVTIRRRSPMQYIRYRLSVWAVSWGKLRMRRLLRRCIRRI